MTGGGEPGRIVVRRARLFDSPRARFLEGVTLLIEGGRLVEVSQEPLTVHDAAREIDAGGRAVLPGLIDAHVHVTAASHDLMGLALEPASLVVAQSAVLMRAMLQRGFTTVRDAAGADRGLREAVARGLFEGPRLKVAGRPISQTGGHADMRPAGASGPMFCSCAGIGLMGAIADGVGEVRRAVREQVRQGVDQIKIMAGGGVSSPTDPIDGTQFSIEELRAGVEEAEAANLYAMAHAYSPRAVTRAVQAGVRSIEHGNLIDEATARVMKQHGAFLVPTLSTYEALADEGQRLGWPEAMLAKLEHVRRQGLRSLAIARAEGVPIVHGSDLLGHMQARQSREFAIRAEVLSPLEILQGATHIAARMMGLEHEIGVLQPGAAADLLIVDGDPAVSTSMLAEPGRGLRLVMQSGRVIVDRLAAAPSGPQA